MRIGIDARLLYYRRAGIGQYTLRLTEALAAEAPRERIFLLHDWRQRGGLPQAPNLRHVRLYTPSHHRWEHLTLPLELLTLRLDLLHSPDFILPQHRPCAGVITVHDLAFLRFPHLVTPEAARYYGRIHQAAHSAERVIAVSECTRRDVLELLGVPEERVRLIYEAAGAPFRPLELSPDERRDFRGRHLAAGRFALFVGTIEPRKNLPTLLRAFRRMMDRYPDLEPHPRLAIVGEQGWLSEEVFALLQELRLVQEVAFIGPVMPEELVWLYNAARFLAFPSLYEGFGLPPLEAMACGTPVLAGNTSSLPEVVGEAGLLVNPLDEEEVVAALGRLLEDASLRAELGRRGRERAAAFSWERTAQETLRVYARAAAGHLAL